MTINLNVCGVSAFVFYNFLTSMVLYKPRRDECGMCVRFRAKHVRIHKHNIHHE